MFCIKICSIFMNFLFVGKRQNKFFGQITAVLMFYLVQFIIFMPGNVSYFLCSESYLRVVKSDAES